MADPNDEKAKRVKNLLSLYYAQGDGADGGGASDRKVTAIDSAAFDAEAYVANLVRSYLFFVALDKNSENLWPRR